jgi:hypothetical protein
LPEEEVIAGLKAEMHDALNTEMKKLRDQLAELQREVTSLRAQLKPPSAKMVVIDGQKATNVA